jgi:hypothetical protein
MSLLNEQANPAMTRGASQGIEQPSQWPLIDRSRVSGEP